jgi:hypothetical protein
MAKGKPKADHYGMYHTAGNPFMLVCTAGKKPYINVKVQAILDLDKVADGVVGDAQRMCGNGYTTTEKSEAAMITNGLLQVFKEMPLSYFGRAYAEVYCMASDRTAVRELLDNARALAGKAFEIFPKDSKLGFPGFYCKGLVKKDPHTRAPQAEAQYVHIRKLVGDEFLGTSRYVDARMQTLQALSQRGQWAIPIKEYKS